MITFEGLPGRVVACDVCDDVLFLRLLLFPWKGWQKSHFRIHSPLLQGFVMNVPTVQKSKLGNLNKPFYFPSSNAPTRFNHPSISEVADRLQKATHVVHVHVDTHRSQILPKRTGPIRHGACRYPPGKDHISYPSLHFFASRLVGICMDIWSLPGGWMEDLHLHGFSLRRCHFHGEV